MPVVKGIGEPDEGEPHVRFDGSRGGEIPPGHSLRPVSRLRGGPAKQPGSNGTTLAMVENPDDIVVNAPKACAGCGGSLADAATTRRQLIDLPVVTRRCPSTKPRHGAARVVTPRRWQRFLTGYALRSATGRG